MGKKMNGKSYSFRLSNEESARFEGFGSIYSARNAFTKKSHLIRAWLNLQSVPESARLTNDERDYLSGLREALPEPEQPEPIGGSGFLDAARPGKRVGRGKPNN